MCVCVCVCVCVRAFSLSIYIYIYICVCVCVFEQLFFINTSLVKKSINASLINFLFIYKKMYINLDRMNEEKS